MPKQPAPGLFDLTHKTAVVIGGGGHVCSALAEGFAAFGANVVVADLRIEKAAQVANAISEQTGTRLVHCHVDATSRSSLKSLLDFSLTHFNSVDILLNGAGINSSTPFLEIEEHNWHEVVNSQLTATFLGCQTFGKYLIDHGGGSIINISSASADVPLSKAFAYSASKSAIRNLTQNLAREWAPYEVRVNSIRPGFFPTEWNRKNFITPEREQAILKHTPMNRFGNTHELIGAAVFLASKAASFVTGSEVIVDGGFSAMTI